MEIQEVGISQLNEALSALAFELASALDDVSEVIDNTENAANTENTEVAANTGNGDNVAVTGNTVIGGTPNPPLKPKNKIILSPSAA
ncbi:hypothetical protein JZM24_07155 [Candidatus Sodalis endolongispinus]|uniref:Uncharacterized protein n=1 Tax=Candidatus Sodalis endolongispinus TaxID=2812662 RepID=A0ABS5YAE9_9GAMM|nr:hypothetical protein [Candidatus Sodalis endolongispinus]MBT9431967.1 hypothetical protein [Candidatus Sodalis endolongispinus]